MAQTNMDEEVPRSNPFGGAGQDLGIIHKEVGLGQLSGPHSPAQTSWPRADMHGTGPSEPIKRASSAFSGSS